MNGSKLWARPATTASGAIRAVCHGAAGSAVPTPPKLRTGNCVSVCIGPGGRAQGR